MLIRVNHPQIDKKTVRVISRDSTGTLRVSRPDEGIFTSKVNRVEEIQPGWVTSRLSEQLETDLQGFLEEEAQDGLEGGLGSFSKNFLQDVRARMSAIRDPEASDFLKALEGIELEFRKVILEQTNLHVQMAIAEGVKVASAQIMQYFQEATRETNIPAARLPSGCVMYFHSGHDELYVIEGRSGRRDVILDGVKKSISLALHPVFLIHTKKGVFAQAFALGSLEGIKDKDSPLVKLPLPHVSPDTSSVCLGDEMKEALRVARGAQVAEVFVRMFWATEFLSRHWFTAQDREALRAMEVPGSRVTFAKAGTLGDWVREFTESKKKSLNDTPLVQYVKDSVLPRAGKAAAVKLMQDLPRQDLLSRKKIQEIVEQNYAQVQGHLREARKVASRRASSIARGLGVRLRNAVRREALRIEAAWNEELSKIWR